MRVSKEVMAANNAKIVSEAARIYREQGIAPTSVAEVMTAAGLTHGGFYRHFSSKEELACRAIGKACNDVAEDLSNDLVSLGGEQAIRNYINKYLSKKHVENVGVGCPIAVLSAEVNRSDTLYFDVLNQGRIAIVGVMAQAIADKNNCSEKLAHTIAMDLFVILVGALVVARTLTNSEDVEALLARAKLKADELVQTNRVSE